ncbi:MAG: hypothetical protein ACRDWD_13835, partial [Acidimicrobiia bacterium]
GTEADVCAYDFVVRRVALILVASALGALVVACGDDSEPESMPRPPNDFEELAAIFDPMVEPMGLEVTRGSLVDIDSYDESDTGNHLALYVEPTGEYSQADYVNGITQLTNLLTPMIFDRYSALDSYDICQEPPPDEDDQAAPPPVTQFHATRAQADVIDFPVTLEELRALYDETPRAIERLYVDPSLEKTRGWKAAAPPA